VPSFKWEELANKALSFTLGTRSFPSAPGFKIFWLWWCVEAGNDCAWGAEPEREDQESEHLENANANLEYRSSNVLARAAGERQEESKDCIDAVGVLFSPIVEYMPVEQLGEVTNLVIKELYATRHSLWLVKLVLEMG